MLYALLLLACTGSVDDSTPSGTDDTSDSVDPGPLTLASTNFAEGEAFPDEHTCAGADRQPELHWTGVPDGTLSFALTLTDESIDYVHWVAFDLDPGTTALAEGASDDGALPAGSDEARAYGTKYKGPCPQGNEHTYTFTLWALSAATTDFTATNPIAAADLDAAFGEVTIEAAGFSGTSDASP